jgi:hypothetical protein
VRQHRFTRDCQQLFSVREIRPAPRKRTAGVVPLFLVKLVVAAEISRYGRGVREIHVVRTGCHYYAVTTVTAQEAAGHD